MVEAGRGGARVSLVSLPREEAGSCSPPAESPLPGDVALSQLERATISRRFSVKPIFARWEQQQVRVVYLPAPDFGPNSVKIVCSSCQVF